MTFFKHKARHVHIDAFFEKPQVTEGSSLESYVSETYCSIASQTTRELRGSTDLKSVGWALPKIAVCGCGGDLKDAYGSSGVKFHSDELFPCVGSLEEGSSSRS